MSRMMRHGQEKKNNDKVYHGGQTVSFFFPINMQFFFRIFWIFSFWVNNSSIGEFNYIRALAIIFTGEVFSDILYSITFKNLIRLVSNLSIIA